LVKELGGIWGRTRSFTLQQARNPESHYGEQERGEESAVGRALGRITGLIK